MRMVYKTKVIDYLRELADYDYQQRVWLSPSGLEISSFTEAICGLFDDSGLGDALDKGQVVFTPKITNLLHDLDATQRAVNESQAPDKLIDDPKMERVRKLAAEILSAIERKK